MRKSHWVKIFLAAIELRAIRWASRQCRKQLMSGDDPLDWLRDSIPGEPGVDYPIFAEVQDTAFSCEGRKFGGRFVEIEII